MRRTTQDPSLVSFSLSLYETLLKTYPSGFRHEYGPHMAQVFRDYCLRTYRLSGPPGMLSLWTLTLLDYFKTVVEEHLQKGIHMSKSKFIRLSGWALILGALTFVVAGLINLRDVPAYNPNNFLSKPIDLYFEYASMILIPTSMFLFMVGMIGLYLRYGDESNGLGKGALIMGIIAGVTSFGASILLVTTEAELVWTVFMAGFLLYFLGLVFFGIGTIRETPLPRWKALPILAGIWFPLLIIVTNGMDWEATQYLDLGVFLLTSIGLAGLGYLLQSDSQPAASTIGEI